MEEITTQTPTGLRLVSTSPSKTKRRGPTSPAHLDGRDELDHIHPMNYVGMIAVCFNIIAEKAK